MAVCNSNLPNLGTGDCPFDFDEIKAFGFFSVRKEDGSLNSMTTTNVALIAQHQTLFDKYNFSSDKLEKEVITPIIYGAIPEQEDAEMYSEAGFEVKTADGVYTIKFKIENANPDLIKQYKKLEKLDVGVFMYDEQARVAYRKSGTTAFPLRVRVAVKDFQPKSREIPPFSEVTLTLRKSEDMNELDYSQVVDASGNNSDIYLESDFFSLNNATNTISDEAVTGGTLTIVTDRFGEAVTGVVFGEVVFKLNEAPFTIVTLAGAGSIDEVSDGVYDVDEAALLVSGKTYEPQISHSGYDIVSGVLLVP